MYRTVCVIASITGHCHKPSSCFTKTTSGNGNFNRQNQPQQQHQHHHQQQLHDCHPRPFLLFLLLSGNNIFNVIIIIIVIQSSCSFPPLVHLPLHHTCKAVSILIIGPMHIKHHEIIRIKIIIESLSPFTPLQAEPTSTNCNLQPLAVKSRSSSSSSSNSR